MLSRPENNNILYFRQWSTKILSYVLPPRSLEYATFYLFIYSLCMICLERTRFVGLTIIGNHQKLRINLDTKSLEQIDVLMVRGDLRLGLDATPWLSRLLNRLLPCLFHP